MTSEGRKAQATVYEIAERAGVSIATVSRVVNGVGGIRLATRARVVEAIEALGYVPNGLAQGMARRSTGVIGLVYRRRALSNSPGNDPASAHVDLLERTQQSLGYYDELIRGVEEAACDNDKMVLLRSVFTADETAAVLAMTGKCDGLVFMDRVIPDAKMARITRRLPVASIAHSVETPGVTNVLVDNEAAMISLVDHMIDRHNARRFAFIGGPAEASDAVKRADAVFRRTAERGAALEPLEQWRGDYTPGTAFDVVMANCSSDCARPDVIMGVNDGSAMGAISALTTLGLRVPADVAVTGFDDMELARLTNPPLTTVHQSLGKMARLAVEALSNRNLSEAGVTIVPAELVVRRSCGC